MLAPPHRDLPRWQRFAMFPAHTLTGRTGIGAAAHRFRSRLAATAIKRNGLDRLVADRDARALTQDAADLHFLYSQVRTRRPKRVIEFGSGQSTVVMAQAISEAGHGHIWSLDADRHWLEHTRRMLGEHLSAFVTLVHSPVVLDYRFGEPAWRYTEVPTGTWDFAVIDGPELTNEGRMSCDLIDLATSLEPGAFGFIDHRWRTAVLARQQLGRRLRMRFVPTLESFVFHG